jgi:NADP-dependent 3-hydroxy acid dehydrogenase YdfG
MPLSLKNQAVLVVGASSGMGREIALQFAAEGARVMASARREDRLRELLPHGIHIHAADAADPAAMEALAQETLREFGRIDIMVFATGTNIPDRAMSRLTVDIWNMMVSVNLNAAYYATRAVLPQMREQKAGSIYYISSRSGIFADESGASYQAAKRGLIGLSQAVRLEEKDNGIRTCVVCPGLTDTDLILRRPVKTPAETLAKAMQSEDVAELVVSLAKLHDRVWIPEVQIYPAAL